MAVSGQKASVWQSLTITYNNNNSSNSNNGNGNMANNDDNNGPTARKWQESEGDDVAPREADGERIKERGKV